MERCQSPRRSRPGNTHAANRLQIESCTWSSRHRLPSFCIQLNFLQHDALAHFNALIDRQLPHLVERGGQVFSSEGAPQMVYLFEIHRVQLNRELLDARIQTGMRQWSETVL